MTIEKWNRIVNCYNEHINSPEKTVQFVWENIFAELLGYSRLNGEIERHRAVSIGSAERAISDIIIRAEGQDLFVVELKQHNLSFCGDKQLLSYLKLLHNDIGVLICSKIYVFDYDYNKNDDAQAKIEIEFIKDNPDGIKFVELFSKKGFSKEAVKKFINHKKQMEQNIRHIKEEMKTSLVLDLLLRYFTEKYSCEEFWQAFSSFNITVSPKTSLGAIVGTVRLKCKKCGSENIRKSGVFSGRQRYQCKNCNCNFIDNSIVTADRSSTNVSAIVDTNFNIINDVVTMDRRQQFISTLKDLYPNLSKGYLKAYEDILTDADGAIFDYDKLYKLLITQYSANRPPSPAWFAQKIPEIIFPEKKKLLGIRDTSDIYDDICCFIKEYQETNDIKKVPIALVKDFCVRSGMAFEHNVKKWFENMVEDFVVKNISEWIICKNRMFVWLERNYARKELGKMEEKI